METFGQRFDLGDVLGKGFDLDFGLEALPIGEAQGNALIIVENVLLASSETPPTA